MDDDEVRILGLRATAAIQVRLADAAEDAVTRLEAKAEKLDASYKAQAKSLREDMKRFRADAQDHRDQAAAALAELGEDA